METINPIVNRWRREASEDPEGFWARAAEQLPWFRKWDRVFERDYPSFRWFLGGETNLAYNCLDHHVARGWGGHAAIIYANERGERRVFTYAQLKRSVERVAAALRGMGVKKGDRVTIYMPVCPEAIMLMLAAVRIGAIHSVVFAGFGAGALSERIRASGSKLVFTTDITFRKGRDIDLKSIVDSAVKLCSDLVESVVVLRSSKGGAQSAGERDLDWHEFLARGDGHDGGYVRMESNEPAFILATSGTTAKPKLAVHV
ncbi:MAG: AMP-binding protein, partial [Chloroflexi bacterium]|nr:AMP-binding protein [Chloroflexota bacterium]